MADLDEFTSESEGELETGPVNGSTDEETEEEDGEPRMLPPGLEDTVSTSDTLDNHPSELDAESVEPAAAPCIPIPTVTVSPDLSSSSSVPATIKITFSYPKPSISGLTCPEGINAMGLLRKPLPVDAGDIVIAPDASYVETSSAPCAIELKRRYDALYGVNVNVRSPYAITAFVGQHGQTRFRVGHRDMSAPGASAAQAVDGLALSKAAMGTDFASASGSASPSTSKSKSPQAPASRRSKSTSIGMLKGGKKKIKSKSPPPPPPVSNLLDGAPTSAHHVQSQSFSRASGKRHSKSRMSITMGLGMGSSGSSHPAKKLRKPRSNPDLSLSFNHHQYGRQPPSYNSSNSNIGMALGRGDPFASVMGWSPSLKLAGHGGMGLGGFTPQIQGSRSHSQSVSGTPQSTASSSYSSTTPSAFFADSQQQSEGTGGGFVARPFGFGIQFESPAAPSSNSRSRNGSDGSGYGSSSGYESDSGFGSSSSSDDAAFNLSDFLTNGIGLKVRNLREMQSFESGLTATPLPLARSSSNYKLESLSQSPTTATKVSTSTSKASPTPLTNTTRLEVDLGGDIDLTISLGEIDFGDVGELDSLGKGKERIIERQRSAIRLSDWEREKKERESTPMSASISSTASTSASASSPPASASFPSNKESARADNESIGEPEAEPSTPRVQAQAYAPNPSLPPRLSKFATYSTEIFDVLQTYRGLPLLDLLDADNDAENHSDSLGNNNSDLTNDKSTAAAVDTTIPVTVKMSLSQDGSAAPKDDPRFVIWGEVVGGIGAGDPCREGTDWSVTGRGRGNSTLSTTTTTTTTSSSTSSNHNVNGTSSPSSSLIGSGIGIAPGSSSLAAPKATLGSSPSSSSSSHAPPTSTTAPMSSSTTMPTTTSSLSSTALTLSSSASGERTRIILAATIERWLAQLTSDLDYDELLNFFLTYRTYIGALDLARLLVARFCWALGSSGSGQDDITRRIVRVRTFVAFKYWLITFFTVDFVPNRDLRLFVASSLNDLGKELSEISREVREAEKRESSADGSEDRGGLDPKELGISRGALVDGLSIVKKLKKVAKDCKKMYTQNNQTSSNNKTSADTSAQPPPAASSSSSRKSMSLSGTATTNSAAANDGNADEGSSHGKEHLLGKKFAEATRKLSAAAASRSAAYNILDADDSDVDLDFIPDDSSSIPSTSYAPVNLGLGGASTLNLNLNLNLSTVGLTLSPPGPGSIPLSSFSILQRTDHAPGPEGFHGSNAVSSTNAATALPIPPHNNVLERVLVKTLGRLGRWKRVLNSGAGMGPHGIHMHRSLTTGGLGRSYVYGSSSGGGFNGMSMGLGTRVAAACTDVSAFDVELTVDSSDLLSSNPPGGVESYLRLVESESQRRQVERKQGQVQPSVVSPSKAITALPVIEPASTSSAAAPATPTTPTATFSHAELETSSRRQSVASTSSAIPSEQASPTDAPVPVQTAQTEEPLRRTSMAETVSDYGVVHTSGNRASFAETVSDYGVVQPSNIGRNRVSIADTVSDYGVVNEDGLFKQASNRESRATRQSYRTSSSSSFGEPLSASRASARFPAFTSPWQFDVVSLDELSDHSSDEHEHGAAVAPPMNGVPAAPPGLRRRRLPLRRELEFEFLERPQTVSSMRSSIVSAASTASRASSSSAAGGLGGGPIQQWQMNALKSDLTDDEEPGDVDEALKRLEGQINPEKQQEKASKVNGWVRTIRERLAAGDYSDEEPMYSDDEDDEEAVHEHDREPDTGSSPATPGSMDTPLPDVDSGSAKTPVVNQVASPARSTDAKPAVEDVVPLEILQSRVPSSADLSSITPERASVTSKFVDPSNGPKAHRSFIISFRAEDLAQHFAMIDRELFMTVKFEELLLEDWMYCEEVNTLDWASFLKDRARWKAESRWPEKTSALGAVRARFNLMVNFTISEIVLTSQPERHFVFSKFLRIAWKSYQRSSFNTLVAIITGLQSEWVMKAMRKSMHKLAAWDNRILTDFKVFTSSEDNFKYIRDAVDAINDAKPLETTSHAPSVVSTGGGSAIDKTAASPSACVPFIGTYLSQLYQYNRLPVLIDPTAPNEVVTFDAVSSNLSTPAHPEVFSTLAPLPSSMHLEPLINVQRQRLIAGVIKSLVAGQHLASRVQFPIDKKLFHKCLRIRGLDSNTLQRALVMLPD